MKSRAINVKGVDVGSAVRHEQDCISLTDMLRGFDGTGALVKNKIHTDSIKPTPLKRARSASP